VTAGVLGNATIEGGLACVLYGPSSPTPHTPNAAQPDSVRVVVVKGPSVVLGLQILTGGACRADFRLRRPGLLRWIRVAQHPHDGYLYVRIAVGPAGAPPSLADEQRLATAILAGLWSVCANARSRALAAHSHRTIAGAHNPAQDRATGIPSPAFP
jgi:hypothetical protein